MRADEEIERIKSKVSGKDKIASKTKQLHGFPRPEVSHELRHFFRVLNLRFLVELHFQGQVEGQKVRNVKNVF